MSDTVSTPVAVPRCRGGRKLNMRITRDVTGIPAGTPVVVLAEAVHADEIIVQSLTDITARVSGYALEDIC